MVVPGSRNVRGEVGRAWGLSLYAPVIVKYRDEKTDARCNWKTICGELDGDTSADVFRRAMCMW